MNASEGTDTLRGPPCRRMETGMDSRGLMPMSIVRKSADMVMFYDGLIYHQMSVNANRLNARHQKKTATNLAFFDGHAAAYPTATLPGTMGVKKLAETQAALSLSNLQAKYSAGPMWLLDQQY